MQYKCEGPGCLYTCTDKHQIHLHHVIPKSNGGSNRKNNLVRLCPNCHNKIYVPGVKRGIHSIKANNYIILKSILSSSGGLVLEYEDSTTSGYTFLDTWRDTFIDQVIKSGD